MSINRSMAKGAAWMVALRMFNRTIGFISTLILARLLVPADFGLVAMGTALQEMMIGVSNFSVDVPLIQKKNIDRSHMDGAWSLQLLLGVAQAVFLLALIKPAQVFYDTPRVANVMLVLAAIVLIKGTSNIGVVMFQREMTFHKDFMLMGAKRLAAVSITLPIAFIWHTYWALLAGMTSAAIMECLMSYCLHPYRPRWDRQRWGELIRFSRWLLANNTMYFINNRGPDFVLGRLIGAQAVGLFSIGSEIGKLPQTELVAPINRVSLPGYARLNESEGSLNRGYLDVTGIVALIVVPAAVGLAATAPLLVPLLLGPNWSDSIPVVRYIALATISVPLTNTFIFIAMGKPWLMTMLTSVQLALLIPGMALGAIYGGVRGVALAYLAVAGVMLILHLVTAFRVLRLTMLDYLRTVGRPIAAAAAMYWVLASIVMPWLADKVELSRLPAALITICFGASIYIIIITGLWRLAGCPASAESRVLTIAARVLKPCVQSFKQLLRLAS